MFFPSTACFVQQKIGATKAACFDVSAACSGFLYAVEIAQQFITSSTYNTVLVIGADKLSSIVDWKDRNTCVLFGDGAGAAILRNRAGSHGVVHTYMGSDGSLTDALYMPGGGCRFPTTAENLGQSLNTIKMNGKETYKQAVTALLKAANAALEGCGPHSGRSGLHHPAPGEPADHRGGGGPDECAAGPLHDQPGPVRQHERGGRGHRAGRGQPHRADEAGGLRAADRLRRRAHLGEFGGAMVNGEPACGRDPGAMLIETHAHLDYPDFQPDFAGGAARGRKRRASPG